MKFLSAIAGGFAGAAILTIIHESLRRVQADAPRMDLLGMEAIAKSLDTIGADVPEEDRLFTITMAGDIISNSLYYSLAAIGGNKSMTVKGIALGLAAGFGAVYLPKPMGLHNEPSNRTVETKLMTIALYLTGGVVASAVTKFLEDRREN